MLGVYGLGQRYDGNIHWETEVTMILFDDIKA